jgi:hypothetical protein
MQKLRLLKNQWAGITVKIIITTVFLLLPTSIFAKNLPVPFITQAPYGNWSQPWQDACEETSVAIVNAYYENNNLNNKATAKKAIEGVLNIKERFYGKSHSEKITQVAELINKFLPWESTLIENPTLEQVKEQLDKNQPILLPAYGKALHNPYFKNGGPDYHLLVISGYDNEKQEFITQEPGTRYGLDFRYKYDTILDANHDFLPKNQTKNGKKIMLFTQKNLEQTKDLDGDNDGLTKTEEIKYGSITWLKDSDGDGYTDGEEVKAGYSPTKKLLKL